MNYKETIKERIKILPEQLRTFIVGENWRKEAEKIGRQFNLDEEKYASLEDEIFFVLLCFEPKNNFLKNISNELEVDVNVAEQITGSAEKEIFSKTPEINDIWKARNTANTADSAKPESSLENKKYEQTESLGRSEGEEKSGGVGGSFEQIILNQAKAMRPAVPANLPTEQSEPKKIHDYSAGNDPYREPFA